MGIQMHIRKKVTLMPHSRIRRDPHKIADDNDDDRWFPFYFVIMMPNTVATIAKAIRRNEYSTALLCASVFLCFVLLKFCLSRYRSLPENEKSSQKFVLKLNMWFLYTAISFGFVYPFADFFPPPTTVALYSVVVVFSLFLFYVFVMVDLARYWKLWIHSEDEHRRLDARNLNDYSVLIWEQV
ncbi:hypothetical protein Lser_V15G20571 [Lactuca serriola]